MKFKLLILGMLITVMSLAAYPHSSFSPAGQNDPVAENDTVTSTADSEKMQSDSGVKKLLPAEDEVHAEFPGGQQSLMNWLAKNIRYPAAAQQADAQGRVVVKFIVETDGSISQPEIVHSSANRDLDEEALRLISMMPKWIPAMNDGQAVSSFFTLPITFRLTGGKNKSKNTPANVGGENVYENVDVLAEFPGGQQGMMKWLSKTIKYPKAAQKAGIQGVVTARFIVEKDGSITNAEILEGVDKDLDAEVLRVIGKMPVWIPGKNEGKPVRSYFTVPVTFKTNK